MNKISIISEKEFPLMERKRINIEIDYTGSKTSSNEEVKKKVAELSKAKEELVVIRHIYPKFGSGKAKVIAHVYKNEAALKRFEPAKKEKKEKAAKNKKQAKS